MRAQAPDPKAPASPVVKKMEGKFPPYERDSREGGIFLNRS